mgnify:CR=1 FL=1
MNLNKWDEIAIGFGKGIISYGFFYYSVEKQNKDLL